MVIITENIAELIGAIIGDGCISYKPTIHQYFVEIVGNITEEKDYFEHLKRIILQEFNLTVSIKIRERGLRLRIYSKKFVTFLVDDLKLIPNKEKCQNIFIPEIIFSNQSLLNYCLRGIADTDGSLFLANKGYRQNYPTIELSTTSIRLAEQIREGLSKQFRIGFRSYKPGRFKRIYRISLNGDNMVDKWVKEIGFSNRRNLNRYQILKCGNGGI